ncbi:MAG: trypsin-like serine protease [Burkholderiales bacterium]|uniref:trypsin-like serine protease n=1 Tax=Inhella sp. TaxID=1921806 RepID=UPI001AC5629D|nr:trypsin-like serine protease [Burkholderiales bacterium]
MKTFVLAITAVLLASAAQAQTPSMQPIADGRQALTGNNSQPSDWRLTPEMGFDGVARLLFQTPQGGMVCSGTLLAGGTHVLTAAHCADNFSTMTVQFGVYGDVAKATRGVAQTHLHPGWTGALGMGADIALLKLDAPVLDIQGFRISTTNDLGKNFLIMGYGTTTVGSSSVDSNWGDWGYGHWGMNTVDVLGNTFNQTIWGDPASPWGEEYIADYDGLVNGAQHNTLQMIADIVETDAWTSGEGLGNSEAIIAGGDSGGGDFVWNGSDWLISGVHSWGWQICPASWGCDISKDNSASWGDLSGSTAVFSHAAWIQGITSAVPEPMSGLLLLAGLGLVGAVKRRRQA